MNDPAFEAQVIAVIAETFSIPANAVSRATTADDVDGWDSLGHSILMVRLSNRLAMPIGEEIASAANDVGRLIDLLADERARHA